jgi:hypothetical protein
MGFDDNAFSLLHHFREQGKQETIESHVLYCTNTKAFHDGKENHKVQRRLRLVLNAYICGGFESQDKEVFKALANAAYFEIR